MLENMTDENAMTEIQNAIPMHEKTIRGGVAFFTWHDSYHVGQIGSIRTNLGLKPIQKIFHEAATS